MIPSHRKRLNYCTAAVVVQRCRGLDLLAMNLRKDRIVEGACTDNKDQHGDHD
jgi:hypothetical protein